jgi:hypothetical protein
LEGLKHLEADFRRMGTNLWRVFAGMAEVDQGGALRPLTTASPYRVLLPRLQLLKVAGVSGIDRKREIQRRAMKSVAGPGLNLCAVRWAPNLKGDDLVLDKLVQLGQWRVGEGTSRNGLPAPSVKIETYYDEDEEELEEELEPEDSLDEDSSLNA